MGDLDEGPHKGSGVDVWKDNPDHADDNIKSGLCIHLTIL